jgi:hypothetical protein
VPIDDDRAGDISQVGNFDRVELVLAYVKS